MEIKSTSIQFQWNSIHDDYNFVTYYLEMSELGPNNPVDSKDYNNWKTVYEGASNQFEVKYLQPATNYKFRIQGKYFTASTEFTEPIIVATGVNIFTDFKFQTGTTCMGPRLILEKNNRTLKREGSSFSSALTNVKFSQGIHYWEVFIDSALLTEAANIWVGVADINNVNLKNITGWGLLNCRCSRDVISDTSRTYGTRFVSGTVGIHVDLGHDTMQFYHERRNLGNAFLHTPNISGRTLSPVVSLKDNNTQITLSSRLYSYASFSEYEELKSFIMVSNLLTQLYKKDSISRSFMIEVHN